MIRFVCRYLFVILLLQLYLRFGLKTMQIVTYDVKIESAEMTIKKQILKRQVTHNGFIQKFNRDAKMLS